MSKKGMIISLDCPFNHTGILNKLFVEERSQSFRLFVKPELRRTNTGAVTYMDGQ
jgi:glycosidase